MASTHTLRTIISAATTNTAAGTTTGTAIDITTKYGGLLTGKITNGATGPTIAAQANIYTSGDNTNFKLRRTIVATVTNSAVLEWDEELPPGVMYVRVDVTGNTAQNVTCECFLQELSTI